MTMIFADNIIKITTKFSRNIKKSSRIFSFKTEIFK